MTRPHGQCTEYRYGFKSSKHAIKYALCQRLSSFFGMHSQILNDAVLVIRQTHDRFGAFVFGTQNDALSVRSPPFVQDRRMTTIPREEWNWVERPHRRHHLRIRTATQTRTQLSALNAENVNERMFICWRLALPNASHGVHWKATSNATICSKERKVMLALRP